MNVLVLPGVAPETEAVDLTEEVAAVSTMVDNVAAVAVDLTEVVAVGTATTAVAGIDTNFFFTKYLNSSGSAVFYFLPSQKLNYLD